MLVPMKVASLTVDPFTNLPIVILKDEGGQRSVPIWIGLTEASAIVAELESIQLARPMTHDLMRAMLLAVDTRVDHVEVNDLRRSTFFATVFLRRQDGTLVALDARPSDAIALAMRTGAVIMVAEKVIDRARRIDLRPVPALRDACREDRCETRDLLQGLGESAFGKWKM